MPTRDELSRRLEALGAHVSSSVSRKTDLLLVGTSPGEVKTSRAKELGIPMLSLAFAEYLQLFARRAGPRGLLTLSDDFLFELAKYMAIYTEELYGQFLQQQNDRAYMAFVRARDATIGLFRDAWGATLEGNLPDWTDDTSHLD